MSESERRYRYVSDRVLIDAERILDPQFDDALVYLTGAQLEMLRNVSQHLDRRKTYVSDYQPGYYLCPTDEDFDTILAIAADLEESLMGNPNTIWGYKERYSETVFLASVGDEYFYLDGETVPAGEVWTVQACSIAQFDDVDRETGVAVREETTIIVLANDIALAPNIPLYWSGGLTLAEDDWIRGSVVDLPSGKYAMLNIWGYKMKVPE